MSKLTETLDNREAARTHLLELRKTLAQQKEQHRDALINIERLGREIKRDEVKLVELTTQVAQLLHADLAGMIDHKVTVEDAVAVAE